METIGLKPSYRTIEALMKQIKIITAMHLHKGKMVYLQ